MTGTIPETSVFSVFSSAAQMAYNLMPAKAQPTGMFLDPLDVITGLAIVALYDKSGEEGIKLSIIENRVRRDHKYWAPLQSAKRLYQGSHDEQLIDLIPPIFYGLKWLQPHKNQHIQTLFYLAKEGIEAIKKTYESEDKPFTATLLHTTHLRLINDGLEGKELNRSDYQCPSWDDSPLAERSLHLWTEEFTSRVEEINAIFLGALKPKSMQLLDDYNVKLLVDLIKDRVDRVTNVYLHAGSSVAEPAATIAPTAQEQSREKDQ